MPILLGFACLASLKFNIYLSGLWSKLHITMPDDPCPVPWLVLYKPVSVSIVMHVRLCCLKLLSHPWWILIPKKKTDQINSSISHIIIFNRILLWISLKSLIVVKKWETNMHVLWTWKDFLVYKYNGIPFAAHLARVIITPHVSF